MRVFFRHIATEMIPWLEIVSLFGSLGACRQTFGRVSSGIKTSEEGMTMLRPIRSNLIKARNEWRRHLNESFAVE